jgi:glycosyltransferase involved in cell wall biosynthesis
MPDFLVFAAIIPRIFGAKIILDIHDPMPEFYMSRYKDRANGVAVQLLQIEQKLSSMLAHAVITANPRFKARLVKRGIPPDKITVINNVADPSVFSRDRYKGERRGDGQHFTLIYPGTIAPRYGLDVAIRALPLLVAKIPQIRLVILGAYAPHVDELAELAQRIGVSSYIQFKPAIPVDEVAQQLVQADIGIYPALPDPHMSIAMPCKVLEYAAMGIPIIASRLEVLEDSFTDSAVMFFEPGDVDEFARCVLELFSSPARRDELVRNAASIFVQAHPWSVERQAYFALLNRLLALKAGPVAVDEKGESVAEEAT